MATKKSAAEVIEIRPIEIKKVTIRIVGDIKRRLFSGRRRNGLSEWNSICITICKSQLYGKSPKKK